MSNPFDSSEALSNTKINVEFRCVLRYEIRQRGRPIGACTVAHAVGRFHLAIEAGGRLATRKCRRIQIVPEIEAHRADGRLVADPDSHRVRDIAVVALAGGALLQAELRILLVPA